MAAKVKAKAKAGAKKAASKKGPGKVAAGKKAASPTPLAAADDRAALWKTLREAAAPLRDVDEKKMFGCEALFANGAIFALVWKTGRIGVKLPEESRYGALLSQKGAEPWRAGPMVMAHWVLVPSAVERDLKKLAPWVAEAHAMAAAGLGATKPKARGSSPKRTAKTKSSSR